MPPLSETAFTLVDSVARQLARMTWPLVFGIFVTLCAPSSNKKRQITLLAKTCRILLVIYTIVFLLDIGLYPNASIAFFANSLWNVFFPLAIGTEPLFWFIFGERAFLHDVNQMYRNQMYACSENKDKYTRIFLVIGLSFGDSMGCLGGVLFTCIPAFINDKRWNMERGFDIPMAVFFLLFSAIIAARAYFKRRELQDSLDSELPTTVSPLLKHTFSN